MDAKSPHFPSETLKYQTWFLKVSIHCEGCRRKVKKVLQSIDGVFTTTIDPQQQKVTVTGSVGVETLIRKLLKAGKHAEVWPENLAVKGTSESKPSSGKNRGIESSEKCNGESKRSNNSKNDTITNSPDKSPAGGKAPEKDNKGGESEGGIGKSGGGETARSGKKKKKREQSESVGGSGSNGLSSGSGSNSAPAHTGSQVVGQLNLSPTRQQSYPYNPETYCPSPMVYLATYNRLCPMAMGGPCYYVPPSPYMCAGLDHDPYQLQSTPLVSFEIFSDENANGCSVM
ncbi:Heavy metal-associated domain, HMA [Sesbania bispinosa]|nr:Heavy metal-associated domain, HMA [Sesbania bispinosa]